MPGVLTRRDVMAGAALGAGVLVGATRTPGARARRASLEPVSLQLNWAPNAEHAPYYLGRDLSFFDTAGIELEILPGEGSLAAARSVGAGASDFGVAVADAVVIARGQGLPVVATAVLLQDSPNVLISLKDRGIVAPVDLHGRRVGVDPQSTLYGTWEAFATINGLDRSRIEEVTFSGLATPLLLADEIDAAIALVTNEVPLLLEQGYDLNIIDPAKYGVQSYGQVLFSSEGFLTAHPELARAGTAAVIESWTYSLDHPAEAMDALAAAVPEADVQQESLKWEPIRQLASGDGGAVPFGTQTLEKWTQTYQTFATGGLVETDFDPALLFSNDFQPAPGPATPIP